MLFCMIVSKLHTLTFCLIKYCRSFCRQTRCGISDSDLARVIVQELELQPRAHPEDFTAWFQDRIVLLEANGNGLGKEKRSHLP